MARPAAPGRPPGNPERIKITKHIMPSQVLRGNGDVEDW